ncbi:hypothetical protein SAMN05216474_0856 [Lishizhenia tianjinensis]|uniref:Uncharacterized protein n=1 Tax=Lishizhenia tianjinensis TaxID=477690 RepID=A0A1I6YF68_9FLAO|nr:hypothetical protein [Lishizhenia tianjinensis]SFT49062.1 hypothetical protein SAMN05216474_0856 [Lishizhenia tianjinensis]
MKNLTLLLSFIAFLGVAQTSCPNTITSGANNTCNGASNCSEVLVLDMNLDTLLNAMGGDSSLLCNTPGNSGVNCPANQLVFANYYLYDPTGTGGNANNNNNNGGNGGKNGSIGCLYNGGGEYIGVLYVALTAFDANINPTNNTVELNWTTAAEKDNDFFTLKKSTDGVNWTVISMIQGAGNSDQELHYSFTDFEVDNTTMYYQLSQTDFDGTVNEFGIITVKKEGSKEIISRTNLLGQDVDEYYKGMVIQTYADGSSDKIYQQ